VLNPVVTDLYGTVRETGVYSVTHRGTDFRASIGTDVYPINRGVVRFAGTLPTYGKAVIVDHGLGITSLYLHLSKIHVVVGQLALPTQIIGKSGDTGFSGGPHLHLSIKIDGVSIDPETFLVLFK
jgi:murein DD-endopeptidase MepM/ murein hydrolase activator NlpD